jgi:hypothetical protein
MSSKTYTLKVTAGPLAGQEYPVTRDSMNLGRASTCDIAIKDLLLSRTHCRFEVRDGRLFVIDLASANETHVNGAAIDEKELHHNDLVEAGETTLRVVSDPPEEGVPPVLHGEADTMLIDLGFSKEEDDADAAKKSFLRPVLWSVAAILILIAGATVIMRPEGDGDGKRAVVVPMERSEKLLIHYEKIEADTANIFRYSLRLSPEGRLSAEIDDIAGDRHIKKDKQLSEEVVRELARTVKASGFFGLDRKYSGYAAVPGTLNQWGMTIALGTQVASCVVRDRQEPDNFKALREQLETFSKNELGIWAIQFSSEKLIDLALEAKTIADKKSAEMNVRHSNLFEAIKSYKESLFYLDTVNPKPDFYAELLASTEKCEQELERRYADQRFKADRAINLKEWANAARELKILREMIPDRADPRHGEAVRKLLDVEGRL